MAANLRFSFNLLRLVLDELADRLTAEAQSLCESDRKNLEEFACEFQQLCAKSGSTNKSSNRITGEEVSGVTQPGADSAGIPHEGSPSLLPIAAKKIVLLDPEELIKEDQATAPKAGGPSENTEQQEHLEEWQEELKQIFGALDVDDSGSLSAEELRRGLVEANVPNARLTRLLTEADVNKSGEIEFNEWMQAIVSKPVKDVVVLESRLENKMTSGNLFPDQADKPQYILHPFSKVRLVLDNTIILICIYLGLVASFIAAWADDVSSGTIAAADNIDIVIFVVFVVEFVLNFFTGFVDEYDEVVFDQREIVKHYLSSWFLLDFTATVPWEPLGIKSGNHVQTVKVLKLVKIVKIFKLLKPSRIIQVNSSFAPLLDYLTIHKWPQTLYRRAKILFKLCLVCHWLACGMKLVEPKEPEPGFLNSYFDGRPGYEDPSVAQEYLAALYWAMTTLTTVGYGDMLPTSDAERVYTLLAMVVGGAFYAYVVGCISSMVASGDLNTATFYDRMDLIHAWATHHRLPSPTKRMLRRHFNFLLRDRAAITDAEIWHDLTPALQIAVGEHIVNEEVIANPLFDGLALGTVIQLQEFLKKVSVPQGCIIAQQGEAGTAMYILLSGSASLDRNGVRTELGIGQSFGEEILLGFAETYNYTVKTNESCMVQVIREADFLSVFEHMPNVLEVMRKNALEMYPHWGLPNEN